MTKPNLTHSPAPEKPLESNCVLTRAIYASVYWYIRKREMEDGIYYANVGHVGNVIDFKLHLITLHYDITKFVCIPDYFKNLYGLEIDEERWYMV